MTTEETGATAVQIKVNLDEAEVAGKITNRVKRIQAILDARVLQDSNYYCPLDTSMLQKSGILHTVLGSGKVIWQTPYARMQYYTDNNKSTQHNPNACYKWFEAAKAKNLKTWEKIVNEEYKKQ